VGSERSRHTFVLTLQTRLGLLERAVPGGEIVAIDDQGSQDRARLAFRGTSAVRFAYLDSADADGLTLRMYPADTLEQARVFFTSPARVQRTLALREHGWTLDPHFHWGFITRGFCWTRSSVSTEDYARYWVDRIEEIGAVDREDWERELQRLIDDGIFSPSDRAQFQADFTQTKRDYAVPRPTLKVERLWSSGEAQRSDFPDQLRAALLEALTAMGESPESLR
jgi:hypothetical protein